MREKLLGLHKWETLNVCYYVIIKIESWHNASSIPGWKIFPFSIQLKTWTLKYFQGIISSAKRFKVTSTSAWNYHYRVSKPWFNKECDSTRAGVMYAYRVMGHYHNYNCWFFCSLKNMYMHLLKRKNQSYLLVNWNDSNGYQRIS